MPNDCRAALSNAKNIGAGVVLAVKLMVGDWVDVTEALTVCDWVGVGEQVVLNPLRRSPRHGNRLSQPNPPFWDMRLEKGVASPAVGTNAGSQF